MNKLVFVRKNVGGLSTDEVIDIFEGTESMSIIRSAVENALERLYVTWASVEMKDKAGEMIPVDDMAKQVNTLLLRGGPITDEHSNKIIGRTLAYKLLIHPDTQTKGILLLNKIFDDNGLDDQVWQEIVSGERQGSSVGGVNSGLSFSQDKVTGTRAKVLEGFDWLENASVYKPCNPFALNEAYSVVAKSDRASAGETSNPEINEEGLTPLDKGDVKKPAELDRCVQALMDDPDFKPEEGRTKEESAYAVCTAQLEKKVDKKMVSFTEEALREGTKVELEHTDNEILARGIAVDHLVEDPEYYTKLRDVEKQENHLNKQEKNRVYKRTEGDNKMEEDVKKSISELSETVKSLVESVSKMKKKMEDMEEKPEPEEKKKVQKEEEDKEPVEDEEEEKKKVKKEEAASDIDGITDAPSPESPDPEESNDKDVYKQVKKAMDEKFEDLKKSLVGSVSTPRSSGSEVKKADGYTALPMDLAMGKKKMTYMDVHKAHREFYDLEAH